MANFILRPDGNITQSGFTGGFAEIAEAIADDSNFAYGANNAVSVLEVSLSDEAAGGAASSGVISYRIAKTNNGVLDDTGNAVSVTAELYQGATLVSSDVTQTVTGIWTQYSWSPDLSTVTDLSDIRLRFTTSGSGGSPANRRGGAVSWAEFSIITSEAIIASLTQSLIGATIVSDGSVADAALEISANLTSTLGIATLSADGIVEATAANNANLTSLLATATVTSQIYTGVTLTGNGLHANGSTSVVPAIPPGEVGELLILNVVSKYPPNAPTTPTGWTLLTSRSGGSGTTGIDTGQVGAYIYTRIADGTEGASLTVTVPSGNSTIGQISRFSKSASGPFEFEFSSGVDTTIGTDWSVTGDTSISIARGDILVALSGVNASDFQFSNQAYSPIAGTTISTMAEIVDASTTFGEDVRMVFTSHQVTAGSATAAPTYSMSVSTAMAGGPCGPTITVRIRAQDSAPTSSTANLSVTLSSVTATINASASIDSNLTRTLGVATVSSSGGLEAAVTSTGNTNIALGAVTLTGASSTASVANLTRTLSATTVTSAAGEATAATSTTITLRARSGVLAANLTGIKYAWWDDTNLATIGAPVSKGSGLTTNSDGTIVVPINGTTRLVGEKGLLMLFDATGTNRYFGITVVRV